MPLSLAGRLCRMFGPTVGDQRAPRRHRSLVIEVEARPHHLWRGSQIRRRQGHPRRHGPKPVAAAPQGAVDTVITNALDPRSLGHRESDIGIKDGRIAAIGKAGNPDIQPGVDIIIGPGTEVIAGEGKIVTAGGIRHAYPFHLPAADRRSADVGHHHDAGRRHRSGHRHARRRPARPAPGTSRA